VTTARPTHRAALALIIATSLASCGKVTEIATQKATEKMIESQVTQDGGTAKVDLGKEGGVAVEGTDKDGKSFKMEMGSAQVTEKELGMPFYPGAKPVDKSGTRMRNGELQMASVELATDADAKKVSAWYREQLKAQSEGRTVIDSAKDNGMQLHIIDEKAKQNLSVEVAADGDGSKVTLMRSSESQ
jgi:hypothetical protein